MFRSQAKIISCVAAALALTACAGTVPTAPVADNQKAERVKSTLSFHARDKRIPVYRKDYTIGAKNRYVPEELDGVKLLGWNNPRLGEQNGFDVTVEVQGVGLQFEGDRTYGYMRADRAFTTDSRMGVRFRFRF